MFPISRNASSGWLYGPWNCARCSAVNGDVCAGNTTGAAISNTTTYRRIRMEGLQELARIVTAFLGVGSWDLGLRVQPGGRVRLGNMDFVEDFLLGEHTLRRLGAAEHAVDDVFGRYESVLLEPEHDVRFARERA